MRPALPTGTRKRLHPGAQPPLCFVFQMAAAGLREFQDVPYVPQLASGGTKQGAPVFKCKPGITAYPGKSLVLVATMCH